MFFFFNPEVDKTKFQKDQICEIISVPHHLFASAIGRKILITSVDIDMRYVWAHDALPPRYGINRNGKRVKEYDPKMCESLYSFDHLRILEGKEENDQRYLMKDSW